MNFLQPWYFNTIILLCKAKKSAGGKFRLPIIPTDLFPREVSAVTGLPYQRVKTVFDLSCLAVTLTLLLAAVHRVSGIGVGTVFCALVMGKVIARAGAALERRFCFVSFLEPEEN